jgi:hypothetical protein
LFAKYFPRILNISKTWEASTFIVLYSPFHIHKAALRPDSRSTLLETALTKTSSFPQTSTADFARVIAV